MIRFYCVGAIGFESATWCNQSTLINNALTETFWDFRLVKTFNTALIESQDQFGQILGTI